MRIGRYEVQGEIGRGGVGVVYRARAPEGRDVAIKVLAPRGAHATARFDRERRLLGSLGEAEGFVPLLDSGATGPSGFIVMPYLPGGTLGTRLRRGRLSLDETLALAERLAAALGRAHERGIVHRDLKPENIIFTAEGAPLVADLGIAKHFDDSAPGASQSVSLSKDGALSGTPGYMPPEQLRNASAVGPEADVFALGAIFHECLTGRRLFEAESLVELMTLMDSRAVPGARERASVPAWLERVLARALARDPARRYPDGHAFARALGAKGRGGRRPLLLALGGLVLVAATLLASTWHGGAIPEDSGAIEGDPLLVLERGRGRAVQGDLAGALADFDRALALDPRLSGAFAARASIERGREAAIADWGRALALEPRRVAWLLERGSALLAARNLERALEDATRAVELDPGSGRAFLLRAAVRFGLGDAGGAADLERGRALDPGNARGLSLEGDRRFLQGDRAGAREAFDRATRNDPTEATGWSGRGRVRFSDNDFDGAIEDLDRALAIDPGVARTWSLRAMAAVEVNDLAMAVVAADRALALYEPEFDAWYARGAAHVLQNDASAAIADLTRATELVPGDQRPWFWRAWARWKMHDLEGALADSERALAITEGTWAWATRGLARAARGDRDGATSDLERSLTFRLKPEIRSAVEKELARLRRR